MNPAPDRYVVFGNPIAHSLSPQIHGLFAEQTGQQLSYERQLVPVDGFAEAADAFFSAGGAGANITVPFKQAAAEWVADLDPAAQFAGAVNTIVPKGTPQEAWAARSYAGFNTDGAGLLADLRRGLGQMSLNGARMLILGAGGAVRGVLEPLARETPAEMILANRTAATARDLASRLAAEIPELAVTGMGLDEVGHSTAADFDIVINGTSAGLGGGIPPVTEDCVNGAFCYDMVYGARTAFCDWATANGARATRDGLGMLVEQAAAAFALWRGVKPDPAPVLGKLREDIDRD